MFQSREMFTYGFALLVAVTAALALPAVANAELVVHYQFEGSDTTEPDLAGDDRPGELINGATRVAGGSPVNGGSQALDVSGASNAAVDLGYGGLLEDVAGSTFAAWIKPDTFPNGELFVYRSAFTSGRSMLMAGLEGADSPNGLTPGTGIGFQRRFFDEAGAKTTFSTTPVVVGEWQHLALSLNYQTGDWAWYIDGVDAGSGNIAACAADPQNTDTDNGVNTLGDSSPGLNQGFSGLIDDFRLFDHALSAAEVRGLVPEPSAMVLLASLAGLALVRRRR